MLLAAHQLDGSLSFTQLLNMDLDALEEVEEEEEEPPPKPAGGGHAGPNGIAEVPTRPRTRRGIPAAAASPAPRTTPANQVIPRMSNCACMSDDCSVWNRSCWLAVASNFLLPVLSFLAFLSW